MLETPHQAAVFSTVPVLDTRILAFFFFVCKVLFLLSYSIVGREMSRRTRKNKAFHAFGTGTHPPENHPPGILTNIP